MLSILCPHCREKLTLEQQWQGKTIRCISCGQQLAVPVVPKTEPPPNAADAKLVVTTPKTSVAHRRRKPALGNRIISVMLHLSITLGAVYAGYYLVTNRQTTAPQQLAAEVAELPIQKPAAKEPRPQQRLAEDPSFDLPIEDDQIASLEPADEEVVAPRTSPFEQMPTVVELPPANQTAPATLITSLSSPQVRLLSNSTNLELRDEAIIWKHPESGTRQAATLSQADGALSFQWSETISSEVEDALRNSVVQLSEDGFQHHISLRSADFARPLELDLSKAKQKVIGKFAHLVPPEHVYFELLELDQLPACTVDGVEPSKLGIAEQSTLEYLEATGAATRLTMTKRGKVAMVEVESRYALPSGDEQPMTIAQGNKKVKELAALQQETLAAEAAIDDLRKRFKALEREAKAVPRSRATAFAKTQQLQQLQAEAVTVQQQISYAERLIAQKNVVAADQQAIQKIAALAQQLHESQLAYRFYTLVDGHQVDLLIAK